MSNVEVTRVEGKLRQNVDVLYNDLLSQGIDEWRFDSNAYGAGSAQMQHIVPVNVAEDFLDFL